LAAVFCTAIDGKFVPHPPSARPRPALSDRQNEAVARALEVVSRARFDRISMAAALARRASCISASLDVDGTSTAAI
jgi:hypothetical protein